MIKKKDQAVTPKTESEANEASADKKPKDKRMKVVNTIINVVLIIAIIFAALCTYISFVSSSGSGAPNIFGFQFLSIQTDSMYPTFAPGDLIIDRDIYTNNEAKNELKKGDIITYWTNINGERVLNTHRIENVYDGGEHRFFETKGDKNTIADTLNVHETEVVGIYTGVKLPNVGKALDYLQTSTGFLLVVVIPVFIFFIYHLVQFFRVLFEYQNIKNRIKYEQEREAAEAVAADRIADKEEKAKERAALEAELREKLRAEILESMAIQKEADAAAEDASDKKDEADAAADKKDEDASDKKDEAVSAENEEHTAKDSQAE